jgi:hypothetical protein
MMNRRKKWIILSSIFAIVIILASILLTETIAAASNILDLNYMAFLPLILNQSGLQPEPVGEIISFTPQWELGASSADPSVGAQGTIKGWYTKEAYTNGTKINLELYIYAKGGSPGVGTGSYEIYLPDEIEPSLDWYVGHANVWIAGGGISEFDGSVKWTTRNTIKGPKLIFTFDGHEWSPTYPKAFADLKLRANISYWQ